MSATNPSACDANKRLTDRTPAHAELVREFVLMRFPGAKRHARIASRRQFVALVALVMAPVIMRTNVQSERMPLNGAAMRSNPNEGP